MENWILWPEITSEDETARDIINALYVSRDQFFEKTRNETEKTQFIKRILRELGESKTYKVWANRQAIPRNGKVRFVNREWMYDIHWYQDENHFLPIYLPLVAEVQWSARFEEGRVKKGEYYRKEGKDIPYSGVMFDFQKLLIANAALRLMIFRLIKDDDKDYMKKYFEKAIAQYPHLQGGDPFLIVAYNFQQQQIYHLFLRKPSPFDLQKVGHI